MPSIHDLLIKAHGAGASELHLLAGKPPMIRINGRMAVVKAEQLTQSDVLGMIHSIMDEEQKLDYKNKKSVTCR